jgi:REP element-mobilizing transposase RayT
MPSLSTSTQIYTPSNCTFSAPLLWSVSLFWNEPEPNDSWTEALIRDLRKDDIRLLRHHFSDMQTSHLTVSTKIGDAPSFIVQRVKGRLYYLVKQRKPKPFHGNFAIRSIGKSSLAETQQYVMNQLGHHKMADPELQSNLESLQIRNEDVDLSRLETSSHGAYWYNLHMVFVHQERWSTSNVFQLERVQQKIISVAKLNGLRLAAAGVLTDHVHLLAGCPYALSPQDIAIEFLNALASVWDSKPVYQFGGYVGTVGDYTTNAIT